MDVGDIRLYKNRWQAVEEIERQELRAMSPEEHWQKLNAIVRFALETGMEADKYPDLDRQRVEEWVKAFGKALEMPELWDQIKSLITHRA